MAVLLGINLPEDAAGVLRLTARHSGHDFLAAPSLRQAAQTLGLYACDIVFHAISSGGRELWPLLMQSVGLPGLPDVVAVFPRKDSAAGEFAIQAGCWDVLSHPFGPGDARVLVNRCLAHRYAAAPALASGALRRDGIIGSSPALERALRQLGRVAPTDSSVLILGETGTGKELFAKAIHENSPRRDKPLVVVDCTNLPPTLAESILFGHSRGSFTGAVESTEGLFRQADGGTIFLDELGDLDLSIQKALLRVIQEKRFRPLSANKEVACDFRVIAVTNRNLEEMVRSGAFRQDLYHRVNTQAITLPGLRERADDIPILAGHYIKIFCRASGCGVKEPAPETLAALSLYTWPGNVRELINAMRASVLNAESSALIYPRHLPEDLRIFLVRSGISMQDLGRWALRDSAYAQAAAPVQGPVGARPAKPETSGNAIPGSWGFERAARGGAGWSIPPFKEARNAEIKAMEGRYLVELAKLSQGNVQKALAISGLSRARLYALLKKHSISLK